MQCPNYSMNLGIRTINSLDICFTAVPPLPRHGLITIVLQSLTDNSLTF